MYNNIIIINNINKIIIIYNKNIENIDIKNLDFLLSNVQIRF